MRLRVGALLVFMAMVATPVAGLVCAWTCAMGDDESGHARHASATCHALEPATPAATVLGGACCHDSALAAPAVAPERSDILTSPALSPDLLWAPGLSAPSLFRGVVSWSVCSGGPPGARQSAVLRV
jgi:hypothetical protein